MSDERTKAAEVLALEPDEYYGLELERRRELQQQLSAALSGGKRPPRGQRAPTPPLLAIGAPARVELERRGELPLLVALRATGERDWEVSRELNLRAISVDLERGGVSSALLDTSHKRGAPPRASATGKRPNETNAAAVASGIELYDDLRTRLGLPWRGGRHALAALCYDVVSNVRVVELVPPPPPPPPEGAEDPEPAPIVWRRGSPSELAAPADVEPPEGAGIRFTAPPEWEDPEAPIAVQLGVRLARANAALAWEEVPDDPQQPPSKPVLLGTLLFVRLDADEPKQLPLRLPAELEDAEGPEQRVVARCGLDLCQAASEAGISLLGVQQLYVVFGDQVAGPSQLKRLAKRSQ